MAKTTLRTQEEKRDFWKKLWYDYGGILPITEIALEVSDDTAECIFNNGDF